MTVLTSLVALAVTWSLADAKSLWSSAPATNYSNVIQEGYLLGNGRLGAIPFGDAGDEKLILNVDSLWSGGPFGADNYTGGNPAEEKYSYLPGIRQWIFENGTGNVTELYGNPDDYGTYQVLGNLSVSFGVTAKSGTYKRALDLTTGVHITTFTGQDGNQYTTEVFCSYPDSVCAYQLSSSATLPDVSVLLENQLVNSSLANSSCGNDYTRLRGITQIGPPEGMIYDSFARVIGPVNVSCHGNDTVSGTLTIRSRVNVRSLGIIVAAGTNYDQSKGTAASNYSFKGEDPATYIEAVAAAASNKTFDSLLRTHVEDYQSLTNTFTLELADSRNSSDIQTSDLIESYTANGTGDPYIESLIFDYSRHLLISSSRDNSLPANLQGRWSPDLSAAWSADYHANINLQMNYWHAEQTGLGDLQTSVWRYMGETWVPRGTETAHLLYDAPGWVTHDEMNIFGHTAMKNDAQWADYPASAAWMMQQVTDHFSYSQNTIWLHETGYPLLKSVAQFWLSQLQWDLFSADHTLVVNPCNSPEHGPTTFGCTHFQQLIHQLLATTSDLGSLANDTDSAFLSNVSTTLRSLDKGLHFTSWGGVKEWKAPTSITGYDLQNDTHRHLSHLWGWYPGITLVSPSAPYLSGLTNTTIQDAIRTSLYSRGIGNGEDANAGWEKVWRSACWARLNDTERAYFELRYAIEQNFAGNALSMYSGKSTPFQIDANFGFAGAVLAMLVTDVEESGMGSDGTRMIILGPAIPTTWGGGNVKGLRIRGGGSVDFGWDAEGLVTEAESQAKGVRFVDRNGKVVLNR